MEDLTDNVTEGNIAKERRYEILRLMKLPPIITAGIIVIANV